MVGPCKLVPGESNEVFMGKWLVWRDHGGRREIGGGKTIGQEMNGMWPSIPEKNDKLFIGFTVNSTAETGLLKETTIEVL